MTTDIQIYIVALLAAGTAAAVGITLLILKVMGKTTPVAAARMTHFQDKFPELAALPETEQRRIMRRATILPIMLALILLAGFAWVAVGTPGILNFINASSKAAAFVGIVVLAVLLPLVIGLQSILIRRHLRARVR
jgi:hypothetical protein